VVGSECLLDGEKERKEKKKEIGETRVAAVLPLAWERKGAQPVACLVWKEERSEGGIERSEGGLELAAPMDREHEREES
jgi:hypothetical protein